MTDEKLIEEAFKAHEDAPTWQDDPIARDAAIRWHMRGFNDARAVFEKAHAPTDDEREALAEAWDQGMAYGVNYDAGDYEVAPEPIENPYRRSEVPEPQVEHCCAHPKCPGGSLCCCQQEPEPQGEPMRGTFGHAWPCPLFYVGNWGKENQPLRECAGGYCATEPQGEPTDAAIESALNAYWHPQHDGPWRESQKNAMRRALRAAAARKGEGR